MSYSSEVHNTHPFPVTQPTQTAASIVEAVKNEAARIQATGSFDQIMDGYRVCSELVLDLALRDAAQFNNAADQMAYIESVRGVLAREGAESPDSDKEAIVDQISELLRQLIA